MAEAAGDGALYRHFVLFSFKPGTTPEQQERALAALRANADLPAVIEYKVGRNFETEGPGATHEWLTMATFTDRNAMRTQGDDARYRSLIENDVIPAVENLVSFDTMF